MENSRFLKQVLIEKVNGDTKEEFLDVTIQESRVSVFLNGEKVISTMCIPKDQDAHAIGFLLSEGVISRVSDVSDIHIGDDGLSVHIEALVNKDNLKNLYKEKTLVSGCGGGITGNIAGSLLIAFNENDIKYKTSEIRHSVNRFYKESELYLLTGCVHKAMLHFPDGKEIQAEDIGRHNAIDKCVGKSRFLDLNIEDAMLIVSGRLSSEMVIKAVMHKIPIVVSRTAPTFAGVKVAQEHGITLIGFARGNKMNLYTNSGRIIVD